MPGAPPERLGHGRTADIEGPIAYAVMAADAIAFLDALLARGLSNHEIAARLVITTRTARNHIEHVYAKIGASSRVVASLYAVQHGLLVEQTARASAGLQRRRRPRPGCILHVPGAARRGLSIWSVTSR